MIADVIVITHGQTESTLRCLKSLRQHTDGYRLVWVDNGSPAESRDAVLQEVKQHSYHNILWLPENLGFIKGANAALCATVDIWTDGPPYVVLLNNDVEVTVGWLDRMITVLENNPNIAVVGPIASECASWQSFVNAGTVLHDFQIPDGFQSLSHEQRAAKLAYCYGDLFRKANMVAFFCTVFRKDAIREVGFLDERFGIGYGDDDDWCYRAHNANLCCAVSMGTYVVHAHRTTFKALHTDEQIKAIKAERHKVFEDKHGVKATVYEVRD